MSFIGEGLSPNVKAPLVKVPVVSQLLTFEISPGENGEFLRSRIEATLAKWWAFSPMVDIKIMEDQHTREVLMLFALDPHATTEEVLTTIQDRLNTWKEEQVIEHHSYKVRHCELIE